MVLGRANVPVPKQQSQRLCAARRARTRNPKAFQTHNGNEHYNLNGLIHCHFSGGSQRVKASNDRIPSAHHRAPHTPTKAFSVKLSPLFDMMNSFFNIPSHHQMTFCFNGCSVLSGLFHPRREWMRWRTLHRFLFSVCRESWATLFSRLSLRRERFSYVSEEKGKQGKAHYRLPFLSDQVFQWKIVNAANCVKCTIITRAHLHSRPCPGKCVQRNVNGTHLWFVIRRHDDIGMQQLIRTHRTHEWIERNSLTPNSTWGSSSLFLSLSLGLPTDALAKSEAQKVIPISVWIMAWWCPQWRKREACFLLYQECGKCANADVLYCCIFQVL